VACKFGAYGDSIILKASVPGQLYSFALLGAKMVVSALLFAYTTETLVLGAGLVGIAALFTEPLLIGLLEDHDYAVIYRHYYLWVMLASVPAGLFAFDVKYLMYNYVAIGISTAFIGLGLCGVSNILFDFDTEEDEKSGVRTSEQTV
jgi:hypothetical protein